MGARGGPRQGGEGSTTGSELRSCGGGKSRQKRCSPVGSGGAGETPSLELRLGEAAAPSLLWDLVISTPPGSKVGPAPFGLGLGKEQQGRMDGERVQLG